MKNFFLLASALLAFAIPAAAQKQENTVAVTAEPVTERPTTDAAKAEPVKLAESDDQVMAIPDAVPVDRTKTSAQTGWYKRPDGKTRTKRYVNSMFGPFSLARSAATAGIATWRDSPEEWGPHWEGFGKRFVSNVGRNVIRQSIIFGLDEALKVDSHFYRSQQRDTGSKIVNALISPVTARKANGKRTIGIPRIAGTYAANIIAVEGWYPERYNYKNALRAGTIALGFNAAFNLFKEFVLKK